MEAFTRGRKL